MTWARVQEEKQKIWDAHFAPKDQTPPLTDSYDPKKLTKGLARIRKEEALNIDPTKEEKEIKTPEVTDINYYPPNPSIPYGPNILAGIARTAARKRRIEEERLAAVKLPATLANLKDHEIELPSESVTRFENPLPPKLTETARNTLVKFVSSFLITLFILDKLGKAYLPPLCFIGQTECEQSP